MPRRGKLEQEPEVSPIGLQGLLFELTTCLFWGILAARHSEFMSNTKDNKNRRQGMNGKLSTLVFVLILSTLIFSGCGPGPAQPTEVPTATPAEAVVEVPEDVPTARDAALAYISENYGDQAPPPGLTWAEERITPEGLVGSETFQYTAGEWVVTISYPVVAPENVIYQIVAENPTTGFRWEGELDAEGYLTEMAPPSEGDFQPLSPAACSELADAMAQALGVDVVTAEAPFEDYIERKAGRGCEITATGTGLDFESFWTVSEDLFWTIFQDLKAMLTAQGWQEDTTYQADGPTGTGTGFRKEQGLCLLMVDWEPSEDAQCPTDQPIYMCELTPEQQLYTVVLNCAEDTTATVASQPEPERTRIQFAPRAISAQVPGSLAAGAVDRYVLTAMAGQQMTVNLSGPSAEVSAILVIWGADGTVLISDHADAITWQGELPLTQDYYINVRSVAQGSVDYSLEVIIPPATSGPREVPPTFQAVLAQLETTGVPLMLPSDFPVEEGLPPIYPYVYMAQPGQYEMSLDYGADCHGAGACHYGSLAGKKVDSSEPVSTLEFVFDPGRAQKVTLANGIEGYFTESVCGASCSDATVLWIYNGFQYLVGLKAGRQSDVLNLANATIENSIP